VHDLTKQSRLQAIGHVSRNFLAKANRAFSQTPIEFGDAFDRLFRGLGTAYNLDKRDQVGRVERMSAKCRW
jgi:hypothetical protein